MPAEVRQEELWHWSVIIFLSVSTGCWSSGVGINGGGIVELCRPFQGWGFVLVWFPRRCLGVGWLWPFGLRFCAGLCLSDGTSGDVVGRLDLGVVFVGDSKAVGLGGA